MSEDDHEEKTLQSDAETGKKVTSNDAYTLLSIVTTGTAQTRRECDCSVRQAHGCER